MSSRPIEIEALSNRLVVHRLSTALLPLAIRSGLSPNMVTLAGLGFGLCAALAYVHWTDWRFATLGFLLMIGWHVMDGLDGQLARATGRTSPLGRLLDGVADYSTFVAVYLALALTQANWLPALLVAMASGLAHALQSAFYEAQRETYVRRANGCFEASPRTTAGGPFERLYNAAETILGNRTRPFDDRLRAMPPQAQREALSRWQRDAAPRLRILSLLSANARTVAIFLACLIGSPFYFWAWELAALTLLALAVGRWLRHSERADGDSVGGVRRG